MTYADFPYYRDVYLGNSIEEGDFPRLALRASSFLDYYTQNRAQGSASLEAVKMACCALAEQYQAIDAANSLSAKALAAGAQGGGAELQSQTVGPLSKTYRSGGDSASAAFSMASQVQAQLGGIARQYLAPTGLLYRGGGCPCSPIL